MDKLRDSRFGGRPVLFSTGRLDRRLLLGSGLALGMARAFAPSRSLAQTPDATPGPQTVDTIHGPVVVPADPQRIVAINFPSVLALLDLGTLPVGLTSYLPALPEGYPDLSDIPVVDNDMGELDLELIASLKPDLILGSDWKDEADQLAPYTELSAIAPTALFEWTQAAGNWEAEAEGCATAIGKTEEFAELQAAYAESAESIRTSYAESLASTKWDLISASETNFYLYGPTSSHGQVLIDAGVQLNAAADQTDGYLEYSFEEFALLAETGALLVRSAGDEGLTVLAGVETYTTLPAVVAGNVFTSNYFFPASYGLSMALLADVEVGLKALSGE